MFCVRDSDVFIKRTKKKKNAKILTDFLFCFVFSRCPSRLPQMFLYIILEHSYSLYITECHETFLFEVSCVCKSYQYP